MGLSLILLVLAAFCFFVDAIGVNKYPVNLTALGLFLLTLTFLIGGANG